MSFDMKRLTPEGRDAAPPKPADVVPIRAALPKVDDGSKVAAAEGRAEDGAAKLSATIEDLGPFEDQNGGVNVTDHEGDLLVALPINTEAGSDRIADAAIVATGKAPNKAGIDALKLQVRLHVRKHRVTRQSRLRVAALGGRSYAIRLGRGRAALVAPGRWTATGVKTDCHWLRARGMGELPEPRHQAGGAKAALLLLLQWASGIGIPAGQAPLLIATMIEWLRPDTPYPILLLVGPAGSGKSTAARMVLQLIDPTDSGTLPSVKMSPDDIAAAAQSMHVLAFDNVSRLPVEVQDTFCVCATGGSIIARLLYTNGEAAVLQIHRPILITAVQSVATRADMLSRAVVCELGTRRERRSEAEIMGAFDTQRPLLLGALLDLMASALEVLQGNTVGDAGSHRLFDFAQMGRAVWIAAGQDPDGFTALLDAQRARQGVDLASGDAFVQGAVRALARLAKTALTTEKLPGWRLWWANGAAAVEIGETITVLIRATRLRGELAISSPGDLGGARSEWMPANDREAFNALTRATPLFEALGIRADKRSDGSTHRWWQFDFTRDAITGSTLC